MWIANRRNNFQKKIFLVIIVLFLISFLSLSKTMVKSTLPSSVPTIVSPIYLKQELTTPTELETFLDSIIPNQLENYTVAGVTFSMVKDGSVFLEKGYGYANYPSQIPVVVNETLFRIGSISKTFTSVAVLQLVEDELLDLDDDINDYLTAFKIPETYDESITLRHLLTHTAGFERSTLQTIVGSSYYIDPLETVLAEGMPDRVRKPGTIAAYSNYGFALAGYIVQEISGKNFETYIQDEILTPLGMNSTTFLQPLPASLSSQMSTGHGINNIPGYFEYISIPPAGSCSSTASDMSKFMMTLLNNGTFDGSRILENASVEMMLSDQFTTHVNLSSIGLGVYEFDVSDQHIIGHGGDTGFFHSRMILLPELNIGIFASYNSVGGSVARNLLFQEIIEEYFPYPEEVIEPMQGYKNRARKFEGLYVSARRVYSDKPNVDERDYLTESFSINAEKGFLTVSGIGDDVKFVEVEHNYFVEATGDYYLKIVFIEDSLGRITHFYTNFIGPIVAYERTHPLYFGLEIQPILVAAIIIVIFISLAYWGVKGLINAFKKKEKDPKIQRIARWSFLLNISLAAATLIIIAIKLDSDILLVSETVKAFSGLLVFPFLYLLSVVASIVFISYAWTGVRSMMRRPYWTLFGRIHYSILVLFSIVLVGIFASWHLFVF